MLRQGNWGLKCEASQDRALKLYPAYNPLTPWWNERGSNPCLSGRERALNPHNHQAVDLLYGCDTASVGLAYSMLISLCDCQRCQIQTFYPSYCPDLLIFYFDCAYSPWTGRG